MKILLVGGTGLISSALTRRLLESGVTPTHFNRGRAEKRFAGDVPVIHGDRKDHPAFVRTVRDAGPWDAAIDMICYTPDDARSLVAATENGAAARTIFCSTVDVYEKPYRALPVPEDHPLGGLNAYGRDKAACERLLTAAHASGAISLTILRPAHTYGEGGGLIHSFGGSATYLDRLRRGKPIVVHGDGQSLWASCHIEDVARAFVNAVESDAARGGVYNVTGDEWLPWDRYHRIVAAANGWPEPTLVHIPTDLLVQAAPERAGVCGDNFRFSNLFDNAAARRDLGFRQTVSFAEGARRVVAWLEERDRILDSDADTLEDRVIEAWRAHGAAFVETIKASI